MSHLVTPRLALALLLLAVAPVAAQNVAGPQPAASRSDFPVLEPGDVQVVRYTPEHVDADDLAHVVQRSFGRAFALSNRHPHELTTNVQQIGDTLLLVDTPEATAKLLDVIAAIDVASDEKAGSATRSFHLRHLSASQAHAVLGGAGVAVIQVHDSRSPVLVGKGSPEELDTADARLAELDVAPRRLMLECLVIRGTSGDVAADARVPGELETNLAKMVGSERFEVVTRGMLTAVAEPGRDLMIELPSDELPCIMQFEIGDFDVRSGELSLSQCEMRLGQQRLQTTTRTRPGEYLVLGATGRTPVFAVLRTTLLD